MDITTAKVTSKLEAIDFLLALFNSGRSFHLDDNPAELGIFSDDEVKALDVIVPALFDHLPDPFEHLIAFNNGYADFFDVSRKDELEDMLDVWWQMVIPDSDHARNFVDEDGEFEALNLAMDYIKLKEA